MNPDPSVAVSTLGIISGSAIALPTFGMASSSAKSKMNSTSAVPVSPAMMAWLGLILDLFVSSAKAPAVSKPTSWVTTSATTTRNGHR